jgi:ribose transport system substrate-binding protein
MGKKEGGISTATLVVTAIIVAVVVGVGVYFLVPKGVSQADYDKLKSDYEALAEKKEVAEVSPKYDLTKDTAYDIAMDKHAWLDWWNNAPVIYEYKKDPPYKIGFITSWRGNPWQEVNIAEFKREVGRSPLIKDYVHMDSAGSVDTEIANLKDMFTMWKAGDLDGIMVDPLDPMALVDTIDEIYDSGCPIILFNDSANTTKYNCYIGNDPWTFGTLSAEWLAKQLNYKGKILFFRGLKGYPIDNGRSGGGLSVFEKYPDIEIAAIEYADWSYDKAKMTFMDMVAAHPEFDGIYSVGGQMSLAIIDAMLELDMDPGKYPHASEDQNGFLQKCVEYNIPAYASCHPSIPSAIGVALMQMMLQGYPVPRMYFYPTPGIPAEKFKDFVRPKAPEGIFVFTPLSDEECRKVVK